MLCNDADAQMIKVNASGDVYCVFHTACEKHGISTNKPLLVALKGGKIYACDATQKAECATVTVNGKTFDVAFSDNTTVTVK